MRFKALPFIVLPLFIFSALIILSAQLVKAQSSVNGDKVGPELPDPQAGVNVVDKQGFTGTVGVINDVSGVRNTVPSKSNRPASLRILMNSNTSIDQLINYATALNGNAESEFPNGAIIILGNELNNLEHEWKNTSQGLRQAGIDYANRFNNFARNLFLDRNKFPVAPAPPDMYNGVYDPAAWLEGFLSRVDCSNINVLVANVFKVPPATSVGGEWNETHLALQRLVGTKCGAKPLTHFQGWGLGGPSQGVTVADQVNFLNTEPLPTGINSAATLIAPNCGSIHADGTTWWYYIRGKVFKADGTEVDPTTCTTFEGNLDKNPFEPQEIACNAQGNSYDDEFHSLRPYPTSTCNQKIEETALFCGNDLIVKHVFEVSPNNDCTDPGPDGSFFCEYESKGNEAQIAIDLTNAELPILGQTELVANSTDRKGPNRSYLTNEQKVNEYVSWYLNGVVDRAEEEFLNTTPSDIDKLLSFAGPLRKLTPWRVQLEGAIKTMDSIYKTRHDQTAACSANGVPVPCSEPEAEALQRTAGGQGFGLGYEQEYRLSSWDRPPLEEAFTSFQEYWRKYQEWRGQNCQISVGGFYLCFSLTGSPNLFASLFPYIPQSSTEDRKGLVVTDDNKVNPDGTRALAKTIQLEDGRGNGGTITSIYFTTDTAKSHNLYFAHSEETSELAKLLQGTFAAKSVDNTNWEKDLENAITTENNAPFFNTFGCEEKDIRTNPGDDLYGEINREGDQRITGTLHYDVKFNCQFKPTFNQDGYNKCIQDRKADAACKEENTGSNTCKKDVFTSLAIYTKTPQAFEIWQRLVDGPMGVFKRFFPKEVPGAPVEEIQKIPASTKVTYEAPGNEARAGDPSLGRQGSDAQLFFPYIGGIQEYFLKGIQKALRPKDVGLDTLSGAPLEGAFCPFENTALSCRNFAPGNGTNGCTNYPGSAQGRGASASISKGVVALAASVSEQTCTPPEIIIGVMAKESTGKKVTSFSPLAEEPVTGDPNQKLGRTTWCKDEYANTEDSPFYRALPGCGPFSYSQIDLDRQIARYDDDDKIKDCINKVIGTIGDGRGIRSDGDIDTRKMATSMCVGSAKLWEGLSGRGTCDHKSHSMSEFDQDEIAFAVANYHGNDEANGNYLSFISQYSGFVNEVKQELTSCQGTASNP